ncbi:MAG: DUF4123 domain-containing protein [Marivita sp.]|uniref:DUF4123 domain-containing protein n=1 Tax=Marivita sp. TaxID=2003365 RepID=UPI003EFA06BE
MYSVIEFAKKDWPSNRFQNETIEQMTKTRFVFECVVSQNNGTGIRVSDCTIAVLAEDDKQAESALRDYIFETDYVLESVTSRKRFPEDFDDGAELGLASDLLSKLSDAASVHLGPLQERRNPFEAHLSSLASNRTPLFALLDGAQFDNLPTLLLQKGFRSRSLYLDRGDNDPQRVITAPHLVVLTEQNEMAPNRDHAGTVTALFDLLSGRPAAVFWQCDAGEDALYKHLRGLNMVLYPIDAMDPKPDLDDSNAQDEIAQDDPDVPNPFAPQDTQGETSNAEDKSASAATHDMVLFRHADANVMAQTLIALDATERARLFGPASRILFMPSPEFCPANEAWMEFSNRSTSSSRGPLKISIESAARIGGASDQAILADMRTFLYGSDPEMCAQFTPAQIDATITAALSSGQAIGFEEDASFACWSYLMLITNHAIAGDADVLAGFQDGKRTPDENMNRMMAEFQRMDATALSNVGI